MNAAWIETMVVPELPPDEVQVWLATFSELGPHREEFRAWLDAAETARAASSGSAAVRERFILSRGLLRKLLGFYLRLPPETLRFRGGTNGKPVLDGEHSLHFNLSHSGDRLVLAFSSGREVGVDVEQGRGRLPGCLEVARKHFAPTELDALLARPEAEQLTAFFRLWTAKEAWVKSHGGGVFSGLERFEVSPDGAQLVAVDGTRATISKWFLARLPEDSGYVGAVVSTVPVQRARFLRWAPR